MSKMMQDESNYVAEYNEVIAEISKVCALIQYNIKNPAGSGPP